MTKTTQTGTSPRSVGFTPGQTVRAWRGGWDEPVTGEVVRVIPANSLGRKHPAHVVVRSKISGERAYPARYVYSEN